MSDVPAPKFAVGEEVIVLATLGKSLTHDYGGQGIIRERKFCFLRKWWGYYIEGYNDPGKFCCEIYLRKKPPLGDDFRTLMHSLNNPIKTTLEEVA